MRLLILGDGRPGHVHLSEGIAAALCRRVPGTINSLRVNRGKWPGPISALLTRCALAPSHILKTVYGLKPESFPASDLIISAGAETLAANVCAARLMGIPNIFYGSLRQYRASDFTLVLTSYPRQASRAGNIVQTLKPSAFDPDVLPEVAGNGPLGLLVGGPSGGGVAFSRTDWTALERLIEKVYTTHNIRWIASNSRRTPDEASAMLSDLAARRDGPIAEFVDVSGPAPRPLPEVFSQVSGVVCTADSSSMISEAIWARKSVIAVEPDKYQLTSNEQDYRAWLSRNGWMTSLKIAALVPHQLSERLGGLRPNPRNPLDDLADLLAQKLAHKLPVLNR